MIKMEVSEVQQGRLILVKNQWMEWVHQIVGFAILGAAMALAIYMDSAAMEWAVAGIWLIMFLGWVFYRQSLQVLTLEEARDEIQKMIDKT